MVLLSNELGWREQLWDVVVLIFHIFIIDYPLSLFHCFHRPLKDVAGQVIVLTGAAQGIGFEQAKLLAIRHRAKVVMVDRAKAPLEAASRSINDQGGRTYPYVADVTKPDQLQQLASQLTAMPELNNGRVDILIANAGVLCVKDLTDISVEEITRTINVNVLGVFYTVKAFLNAMVTRNSGQLVFIGSVASWVGARRGVDYAASKHAVRGLVQGLEQEILQKHLGIKTTAIYPYFISTPMIHGCNVQHRIGEVMTPQEAGEAIVKAVLQEQRHAFIPADKAIACIGNPLLPYRVRDRVTTFLGINFK